MKHIYNTHSQKLSNGIKVSKLMDELTPNEIDTKTGCSVCEEDQVTVKLLNGIHFKICHKMADRLEQVLNQLLISGVEIKSIEGHMVKQTAGEIDKDGNRTKFSQHAFGVALDINREHNGLYENCFKWQKDCQLIHGGEWRKSDPLSIHSESILYQKLNQIGLKWGGEILGKQKDFMHFSLTGY